MMKDLKEESDYRLNRISRGTEIKIIVDGQPVKAYEGESVAAAIYATGRRALRTTSRRNETRGLYCGIGVCFDCVMIIDNIPNVRSCQTLVRDGMVIECERGEGKWEIVS
jgi:aerobic-type carbon monoxide dehydrogenase small subunit (CoxS/CutS family)